MTMACAEAEVLLHALIDNELDARHASDVEAHLSGCARCTAQMEAYRDLHRTLSGAELGYAAPPSLRGRIDRSVPQPATATSRRAVLKGFAAGSVISAAAAASVAFIVVRQDHERAILGEAVSAHLRSLQAAHLTDVQSSDQHAVKPWFNGRIDLAPPVVDLTAQGFTLIGGRLDYIDGKPVAALVYRRRIHVINLFVAQGLGSAPAIARAESVQGFNTRRWSDQGLDLLAVSDINAEELDEFGVKFEAAARTARGG